MTAATAPKTHADSTDRTPVLSTAKTTAARQTKTAGRFSSAARRLLHTLMRSLATPHV